jgi:hypothetical protein
MWQSAGDEYDALSYRNFCYGHGRGLNAPLSAHVVCGDSA